MGHDLSSKWIINNDKKDINILKLQTYTNYKKYWTTYIQLYIYS